ncbi:dynein intermediate chain 3, ciliary-like [Daktulosphaira vitifoliae]|uniref:dynein intermediate chain 3, ciliary-like n=1 Tax=Daktulosphaira vitifoliae TaxID=58002 RepID=UPI0021A977F8|nr:dynein intermediate chain 3, ciliary-like [Daktulosphaira vitifoliae]
MHANYSYTKLRREYGKQCKFNKWGPKILENVLPDMKLEENWIKDNVCDSETCKGVEWSAHDVNTIRAEYVEKGIYHVEGGWPKDVNLEDPEQVVRYKKKTEKDDLYMQAVMQMSSLTEHLINQNNSIDIYEAYFTNLNCTTNQSLRPSFQTIAVMSDTCEQMRPVQHLSWSPDQGSLLAISYANMDFQKKDYITNPDSLIFDLEDSTTPYFIVESSYPIVTLEFNYRDTQCLAGGLMSGQVAYWDIRKSSECVSISNVKFSHRDPVRSLYWINSKTSTEFYTGSSDGQLMWWDTRKLIEPIEVLTLDLSKNENTDEPDWSKWSRSHGVSCMDYDPSIPIRFMVGTETGLVFNGNRKGKTVFEKISATYSCHSGPVCSAQRNPIFLKNFLTVGDWQVRIWSEDIRESPIMWSKRHEIRLTDGAWSETKPSVFYTTRDDGCLDAWDILQKQKDSILTIKVADKGLNCIRCQEGGSLLAVGDNFGKSYVIKMSDWFVTPGKNDKALLTSMFDRETRREKIIEAKQRELKLKTKSTKCDVTLTKDKQIQIAENEARMITEAEKEFFELVINGENGFNIDENNDQEEININVPEETKNGIIAAVRKVLKFDWPWLSDVKSCQTSNENNNTSNMTNFLSNLRKKISNHTRIEWTPDRLVGPIHEALNVCRKNNIDDNECAKIIANSMSEIMNNSSGKWSISGWRTTTSKNQPAIMNVQYMFVYNNGSIIINDNQIDTIVTKVLKALLDQKLENKSTAGPTSTKEFDVDYIYHD